MLLCYIVLAAIKTEMGKLELGINKVSWWRMWKNAVFYFYFIVFENSLENSVVDSWAFCFGPVTLALFASCWGSSVFVDNFSFFILNPLASWLF